MIDTVAIRKRILELAFCGNLVKQDSNDENAELLVKRITKQLNGTEQISDIDSDEYPYEELPDGWCWCRLSDIGTTNIGLTYHPEDVVNEGTIVLRSNNIKDNKMTYSDVIKVNCSIRDNQYIDKNDILVCARNGSKALVGKCAIYDGKFGKISFGAFMAIFRTELSKYVYYYFTSQLFRRYFSSDDTKQINQVTQGILKNSVIPIPPLAEQNRITQKLDETFQMLDRLEFLQIRYASDIETLKSKIIDAGIQGKLTEQLPEDGTAEELLRQIAEDKKLLIKDKKIKKEKVLTEITEEEIPFEIPNNWRWVRLADICSKISSGNTPAGGSKGGAYFSDGFCFFREQNIYNDSIHEDGMVYITEELLNTRENCTVLPKDILLNITGGSIGRCALIPDDFSKGSINQHILIIRVVDPRIRFYVHKCLCSPYYQKLIMGNVVGDKDGFSAGRCKNTLIPLPPIEEQRRIVKKIDELLCLM